MREAGTELAVFHRFKQTEGLITATGYLREDTATKLAAHCQQRMAHLEQTKCNSVERWVTEYGAAHDAALEETGYQKIATVPTDLGEQTRSGMSAESEKVETQIQEIMNKIGRSHAAFCIAVKTHRDRVQRLEDMQEQVASTLKKHPGKKWKQAASAGPGTQTGSWPTALKVGRDDKRVTRHDQIRQAIAEDTYNRFGKHADADRMHKADEERRRNGQPNVWPRTSRQRKIIDAAIQGYQNTRQRVMMMPPTDREIRYAGKFETQHREGYTGVLPGVVRHSMRDSTAADHKMVTKIMRMVWNQGTMGTTLQQVFEVAIYKGKGKDRERIRSYRPLFMHEELAKAYHRIVTNRTDIFMGTAGRELRKIGALEGFETDEAAAVGGVQMCVGIDVKGPLDARILGRIRRQTVLSRRPYVLVGQYDAEDGFPTLSHEMILAAAILRRKLRGNLLRAHQAMISGMSLRVLVGSYLTRPTELATGVSQGSGHSPMHWAFVIDNVARWLAQRTEADIQAGRYRPEEVYPIPGLPELMTIYMDDIETDTPTIAAGDEPREQGVTTTMRHFAPSSSRLCCAAHRPDER